MNWFEISAIVLLGIGGGYYVKDFIDMQRGTGRYDKEHMEEWRKKKNE